MMIGRIAILLLALASPSAAQRDPPAWTRPTPAFHVLGPIWYVGTEGLGVYLVKTRAGAILLDGTLAGNVPAIARNVAAAGVRMRDVRLLLNSHAHFDHAAGLAALKAASGARLVAGAGDRMALDTGVPPGEVSYGVITFPKVRVDRAVRDGDRVTLGGVTLTAHAMPGHTPGNTSWSMRVTEGGRTLNVVFAGSLTVAGNRLHGNRRYPGIVADFRRSFARAAALPADVVLPFHPEGADVIGRGRRAGAGDRDAFLAPGLMRKIADDAAAAFELEWKKQAGAGG
ncbi:subclass B3 metallo-beta-lactamase [Sphingomonas sp.]|jgi:metallo-beta-lactamase class B|uniref:subclass B3 metallo-beta-lactamase n=1 Tax=Sphingomonas sp. TaxID=28214 RepID=UPI002D80DBC9|nr:subclass B3 metallo-beta-lactamase [Sphingomonas sp.]HEU0045774.1 subclass B3 metallo-beta-lactamase [Sphingomonas sp.]